MAKRYYYFICFVLIFSMTVVPVFAESKSYETENFKVMATPRWISVNTVKCELSIEGGKAQLKSSISIASKKADKVVFEVELQQYKNKWVSVKSFNESVNVSGSKALFSKSNKAEKNVTYRFIGNAKIYKSGKLIETIEIASNEKSY